MSKRIINTPQLGVNDITAEIFNWFVTNGQEINIGDILCTIETTKISIEIESDCHGFIKLLVPENSDVEINQPICIIYSSLDEFEKLSNADFISFQKSNELETLTITKKAQMLIDSNNIDIHKHFKNGLIKEKDINDLIDSFKKDVYEIKFCEGKKNILIYGASQGGYTAMEALRLGDDNNEIIGFIDDDIQKPGKKYFGLPVFNSSQIEIFNGKENLYIFIAISISSVREKKLLWATGNGLKIITVQHPNSFVSPSAKIGLGCHIKSGAIIDSNTIIGEGCIIDNNTSIAHDNTIGKFCHLAPGVSLGSNIKIGDYSILGIGSSFSTGITIGASNIISVGSAVTINTESHSILEGNPAKIIGKTK